MREGVAGLLTETPEIDLVETVGDPVALHAAVATHRPDAVLTDIRMPPTFTTKGIDAALTEPVEARLDASGIRTDGERMSIARRWSAFASWSDTPAAVVFATGDNIHGAVLVVPHRAASGPEELAAIRALAEQQLGPALGSGPGRPGRRWWPWVARAVVLGLVVVPLAMTIDNVHDETGEWRLWPAESPPLLSYDGLDFRRVGGPTPRPEAVRGVAYTPGGGLILEPDLPQGALTEVWVLDHENVVRHYVATGPSDGG